MARIRTIKPEFWEDEKVARLPFPCRLFYIATWNLADDNGVFRANPTMLKARIFPFDDHLRLEIVKYWLKDLEEARMIVPISHENESYYVIRTFKSHQKIDKRYGKPLIEDKVLKKLLDKALTDEEKVLNEAQRELPDKTATDKNGKFIPPTIEEVTTYCKHRNNTIDPSKFIDFYTAKGWMMGNNRMIDWKAALRTWECTADLKRYKMKNDTDGRLHKALQ